MSNRSDLKMRLECLFPTPVWRTRLTGFERENARMLREVETLYGAEPALERSNVLGWHSRDDLQCRPAFAPLARLALRLIETEVASVLKLDTKQHRFVIASMWAVRNQKFAYNFVHRHPDCFFSGVYYLQSPDPSAALNFHDPRADVRMLRPPLREETPYTQHIRSYQPEAGALVVFPSWLPHDVSPNLSDSPRIAVSFDITSVSPTRRPVKRHRKS